MKGVAPIEYEVVMRKTCSSFFNGTSIDDVLRNSGIEYTIIVGLYTEQCVSSTARDSVDKGYYTILIDDAVETWTMERQISGIANIDRVYVKCMTTDQVVELIDKVE